MHLLIKYITSVCLFILLCGALPAQAQTASDWQGIDKTQVRLIAATTAVGDSNDLVFGLHFKMAEGWKVYWRSPGDAGYPPEIDWQGSTNLSRAEMQWPRPHRFVVLGLETVGYKKEVVYPLHIKTKQTGQPLSLKAHVRFLTCADICVPVETDLSLTLPEGTAEASEYARLINKFESQVPHRKQTLGINLEKAEMAVEQDGKTATLRLHLSSNSQPFQSPDVLVEGPLELAFFKPDTKLSADQTGVLFDIPLDGVQFLEKKFDQYDYTLSVMDGERAIELTTKVTPATAPLPAPEGFASPGQQPLNALSLVSILALAVLGGLILNLMPCVLPVLSLKVLGLVSHGGNSPRTVRLSFLASSGGIVFSFWVLAGALIAMKLAGASIGWGIQFQQPLFLIALLLVVILFACNMWGFFEINLPGWLSGIGERSAHVHGLAGHFLTGAFATLLATPCSAPFLGTAVGFALVRGPWEIFMVFTALGLGLALPYLMISLFPKLATLLPKPGPWMVILRKVLALALLATALWLLSILWVQIGNNSVVILAVLLGLLVGTLYLAPRLKHFAKALAVLLVIGTFTVPSFTEQNAATPAEVETLWTKFDLAKIDSLIAKGHIVFVDVTADWCLTCKVNKNLVLYQGNTFEALSSPKVIAMKADWTKPDETIAAYLASFKRFAIPFNAVYGPKAPKGILLPELLDEDTVLKAIKQAGG